jgi:transposase
VGQSIPQSEALSNKGLDTTVGRVGQNSPPSEKSESLLLSYLTEPAEFAEQIRKVIADLDAAFVEGTTTIKKVAAQYSLEIVQKAIAHIEAKDPDAAEELRDALGLDTATLAAEQIKKAIANFDRTLAIQVWDGLKAKAKRELRAEVKNHLNSAESENFKLLVETGFLRGTRVKYVGDPKYAEQYEELEVYSIDEHSLITCRKPDGYLTTRMKPEELEKL